MNFAHIREALNRRQRGLKKLTDNMYNEKRNVIAAKIQDVEHKIAILSQVTYHHVLCFVCLLVVFFLQF